MENDLKIQAGAGEICESLPVEEDLSYPFLSKSRINEGFGSCDAVAICNFWSE